MFATWHAIDSIHSIEASLRECECLHMRPIIDGDKHEAFAKMVMGKNNKMFKIIVCNHSQIGSFPLTNLIVAFLDR